MCQPCPPNMTSSPIRFHTEGGRGAWNFPPSSHNFPPPPPPPPPEILKLSMVIMVLSQVLNNNLVPDCVRSNLKRSKFKIFSGEGGGACPQTPLVGMHMFCALLSPCHHPASPPPPPPQLKILYETRALPISTDQEGECDVVSLHSKNHVYKLLNKKCFMNEVTM